jgi:lipopolysaccharide biosynthesis glycosyltransferase
LIGKLQPFNLTEYKRVVQLDSDMLVLDSIDDLMTLHLDGDKHVFAASHACVCNPHNKPSYPANFVPSNCAYTFQHSKPDEAQTKGADPLTGLGLCNGGLQVVNPSKEDYQKILAKMREPAATNSYDFADQSLLSDVFKGRWLPLPYVYNALKTLRYAHAPIWKEDEVKNIHYILNPKPWDQTEEDRKSPDRDPTVAKWWVVNDKRKAEEKEAGIVDKW